MRNKYINIFLQINTNLWLLVINVFVLIMTVTIGLKFSQIPTIHFVSTLGAIWVVIIALIFIANLLFRRVLSDLLRKQDYLSDELGELNVLYASKYSPISNNALKRFEESADKIRIMSPDLADDSAEFYETVLSNIKQKKRYQYIIPEKNEVISKMRQLIRRLLADTGMKNENELSIEYRVWDKSPIILESFLYEESGRGRLKGFVEVCISSENNSTTNISLTNNEAHKLNAWFDKLFES